MIARDSHTSIIDIFAITSVATFAQATLPVLISIAL